ncbi:MAG: hypothetical protein D3906_13570, partial [Candidatus Electrothrix sp. AUS1_2]|nr:hypothetical protein [Candidatus Electrothrix sp. AUS1_2]
MTVQGQQLDLMLCPFCGGAARIDGSFSVACSGCGARRGDFRDEEEAERFWNVRYLSPEQIQAIHHSEKYQSVEFEDSNKESIEWIIRIAVSFILFIGSYYCVTHFEEFIISAGYGELLSPYPYFNIPPDFVFASVFFSGIAV